MKLTFAVHSYVGKCLRGWHGYVQIKAEFPDCVTIEAEGKTREEVLVNLGVEWNRVKAAMDAELAKLKEPK